MPNWKNPDVEYRGVTRRLPAFNQLVLYIERGAPVSSFLQAILVNDLRAAVRAADETNGPLIPWYSTWLMHVPGNSWGSTEAYAEWVESGGLKGLYGDSPPFF